MQSTFIPEILSMPELLNELALFAGAGGGVLASTLLGWRTVCAVELDPYCASVLAQRQNDRFLPTFPIWDDVRTFDGKPWNGLIDVVSGGFPCQDISIANVTATGISGSRSGLWQQLARSDHWRGTTIFRIRGKLPNPHFSRTWKSSWRPGQNGV